MFKKILTASTLAFTLLSFNLQAAEISSSFGSAKSKMYKKVEGNYGYTIYSGCQWSRKKVDLNSCNLQNSFSKKHMKRAKRTEAEHIIPASWFYKKEGEWRSCATKANFTKGLSARSYCQKVDKDYRNAHNDLVNLYPAVGQINADRSNKPFTDKHSGSNIKTYRGNLISSSSSRTFIPPPSVRGDIARVGFYMRDVYGVSYSKRMGSTFDKWNREDPISQEEYDRNIKIKKAQGVANHYVLR